MECARPTHANDPLPENALLLAAVAAIALAVMAAPATAAPLTLTLVHVNDWDRMAGIDDAGGAARIAAVVAEERARAETATALDTRGRAAATGETAFGNLLADAMRAATGADIALSNGGGIRGDTVYPPGTRITRKMVLTELPFGNKTVVLRLTGAQVREALENGVSRAGHGSGRFPQVSGLAFSFDTREPAGARVTGVTVGGVPLEDGKSYTLATNDFLARGGDGYAVFQAGEMLIDSASGTLMAGQLIDHIAAAGTVSPAIEGRITRQD